MNRFDDMRQILERYSLNVDSYLSIETTCTICKRLLIEACRGNCGCKYCKRCIETYLIGGEKGCPGETDECKNGSLSLSINVKDDAATDEFIEKLSVKCPMKDCEYQGQIVDMCDHLNSMHSNKESDDNSTNTTLEIDPLINKSDTGTPNKTDMEIDNSCQEEKLENKIKDLTSQYEILMTTMTERCENYEREIVTFKEDMNKCRQEILSIRNKIENDENLKKNHNEVEEENVKEEIGSLQRKYDYLFNVITEVKQYNERQEGMLKERAVKYEIETDEMREKSREEKMKEESHRENVQIEITDLKTKYEELMNLVTELKESNEKQQIMSDEEKLKYRTEFTEIREQHDKETMELREMLREIHERVTRNDKEEMEPIPDQLNIDPSNQASNDRVTNIASYVWDIGKFSHLKRTKTCIQSDYFLSSNSEYQMTMWLYPNWSENVTDPHIRIVLGIRSGVGDVQSRWPLKSIIDISIKNKFAPDSQKCMSKNRIFEQPNCEVFDFFTTELDPAHVLDNNSLLIECAVRIDE